MTQVSVIIPAYNEEKSISYVLRNIPKKIVSSIIVIDNNSCDATAAIASKQLCTVLKEERQGYGFACLRGINYLESMAIKPDIVVFLDADFSDDPTEMFSLIQPIKENGYDMVIGTRRSNKMQFGAMMPQQIVGNWLATTLLSLLYNVNYTDLGPFRAIRYDKLIELGMKDTTYGWTVEMQLKAAKKKYKTCEVPVSYKRRIGQSKISGTIKGTILAGYKIISTIIKHY